METHTIISRKQNVPFSIRLETALERAFGWQQPHLKSSGIYKDLLTRKPAANTFKHGRNTQDLVKFIEASWNPAPNAS